MKKKVAKCTKFAIKIICQISNIYEIGSTHQGQIQAITRPGKMIMTTIDRLILQYDVTEEDIILVHNDYKRKSGLFFAIFMPIITGAQSIIFPFLVTKQKPWLWVNVAAKQGVTIVRARQILYFFCIFS